MEDLKSSSYLTAAIAPSVFGVALLLALVRFMIFSLCLCYFGGKTNKQASFTESSAGFPLL